MSPKPPEGEYASFTILAEMTEECQLYMAQLGDTQITSQNPTVLLSGPTGAWITMIYSPKYSLFLKESYKNIFCEIIWSPNIWQTSALISIKKLIIFLS